MKKRKDLTLQEVINKEMRNLEFRLKYKETEMHIKIAHLIEKLRLKAEMTQAQLAKKSSVSQPMIARLERGDKDRVPTLSTINKVFRALGYEVDLKVKKSA